MERKRVRFKELETLAICLIERNLYFDAGYKLYFDKGESNTFRILDVTAREDCLLTFDAFLDTDLYFSPKEENSGNEEIDKFIDKYSQWFSYCDRDNLIDEMKISLKKLINT